MVLKLKVISAKIFLVYIYLTILIYTCYAKEFSDRYGDMKKIRAWSTTKSEKLNKPGKLSKRAHTMSHNKNEIQKSVSTDRISLISSTTSGPSWMASLPDNIKSRPITKIAIPGTHDSFASDLDTSSVFAQNTDQALLDFITKFSKTEKLAKRITKSWGITQLFDIETQLKLGIRYLDLRVMPKLDEPEKGEFYTAHSLYAVSLRSILTDVKEFLSKDSPGSNEVVFLDINHLYGMTANDHQNCISLIYDILNDGGNDDIIYDSSDYSGNLTPGLTLKELQNSNKKVLIFYDNLSYKQKLFRNDNMYSIWPRSKTGKDLYKKLNKYLHTDGRPIPNESYHPMYVSQYVMTPDGSVVARMPFSSLKKWEKGELKGAYRLEEWSSRQYSDDDLHGVNIVIADFMTESMIQSVVKCNFRFSVVDKIMK